MINDHTARSITEISCGIKTGIAASLSSYALELYIAQRLY